MFSQNWCMSTNFKNFLHRWVGANTLRALVATNIWMPAWKTLHKNQFCCSVSCLVSISVHFAQIARSMTFFKAYLLSGRPRGLAPLIFRPKKFGGTSPPPRYLRVWMTVPPSSLSEDLDRPLLLTFTVDRQKAWWTFVFFSFPPWCVWNNNFNNLLRRKTSQKITRQIKKQFIEDLKCNELKNTTNNSSERLGF